MPCFDVDDLDVIERWFRAYEVCENLFASPGWASALDSLASELEAKTLLTGDEIEEIVRPFDLAAPLKSLSPIW